MKHFFTGIIILIITCIAVSVIDLAKAKFYSDCVSKNEESLCYQTFYLGK